MTSAELESLIAVCAKHGVTKFKAGDVEVTFSGFQSPLPEVAAPPQASQTAEFLKELQNTKEWMALNIPPPAFDEVE